ncbi:MAG: thioredoxin domain-containing protein [Bryobacteraceae bacterium]|nr:thioredoxin domain-containing protein [Bryobacteraceae bacterium]
MAANRLAQEKSPYLLQHAHNPVDWYPWGEEAFAAAREQDKPIFLSVGYSTCHWCHVMERESFENEDIAAILNRAFIPVKVDREERPDVDRVYMTFVQATTGSGGWPMSVFLTPSLKPFFGGTYFPPDNRYGRPGFASVLTQLATAWITDRARIEQSGADVLERLRTMLGSGASSVPAREEQVRNRLFLTLRRNFDTRLGGFGGAPKFPRPVNLNFLLREHVWSKNEEALEMAVATLRAMAAGGMNDQLGGGFHRYSVDARWFVPHFEKMLYDQAQLAVSYLEAFQLTGDASLADVARSVFDYVLRDLTHPDGGFYSAEDADSVIEASQPHEKGEGAFYVWTWDELEALLGEDAAWFCETFGVERRGNVLEDPHREFQGKNILFAARAIDDPARFERCRAILMAARDKRIRPHLDDKVLTAWNGLMISAFAKGAQVLGDERYRAAARHAASFIRERLFTRDGILLRRWREGEAAIPGFLDDYAFFGQALLDLYETDFEYDDLALARKLTADMRTLFEDTANGGFFSTVAGDENLVLRMKEDYDGAEPSANSIAVINLVRLGEIDAAKRALAAFSATLTDQPSGAPQLAIALAAAERPRTEIKISGTRESARALIETVHRRFVPFRTLSLAAGEPSAEVCTDFVCLPRTSDPAELHRLLA